MWKVYLVRLLLKLIDIDDKPVEDGKSVKRWLADSWQDTGFQEYIRYRDTMIKESLANGVGLKHPPHYDYAIMLGQRIETQRLKVRSEAMFNKSQKK